MSARYLLLVATGCLAACVAVLDARSSAEPSVEEYAVYAALLFDRWSDEGGTALVIQRETADAAHSHDFDENVEFLRKELQDNDPPISLEKDLVESFRSVYRSTVQLDAKRLKVPNTTIVASSEIDSIFRRGRSLEDSWAAFRTRFGGAWGFIKLSRIGFSKNGNRALLSVSSCCGPLCGSGSYVLLQKLARRWRVIARVVVWVS